MKTAQLSKANIGLLLVLCFCSFVEFNNLQSLFFEFMQLYRPGWREIFNQLSACFFAAGLITAIITFGTRNDRRVSWGLALMTMIVSLFVYRKIAAFNLDNISLQHSHIVVLILAILFPFLVAYTTHKIWEDQAEQPDEKEELKKQVIAEVENKQLTTSVRQYRRAYQAIKKEKENLLIAQQPPRPANQAGVIDQTETQDKPQNPDQKDEGK